MSGSVWRALRHALVVFGVEQFQRQIDTLVSKLLSESRPYISAQST